MVIPPHLMGLHIDLLLPAEHKIKRRHVSHKATTCRLFLGADYGARTRHILLGKQTLYQMS